jgi:hypothetical protein
MKTLAALGLGAAVDQRDGAGAAAQAWHLFQLIGDDVVHRHALLFRFGDEAVAAEGAERKLADANPVERLLVIAAQVNIHLAEETS